MSDVQADLPSAPVTPPGVMAPAGDPPPVASAAPIPEALVPQAVETAAAILEGATGPLDVSYVRAELDAILFGIRSGVSNGIDRVESLIRHVESKF